MEKLTVVNDAGHGGSDPGAEGETIGKKITEREIVLSVSKILDSFLDFDDRIKNVLTRSSENERPSLKKRAEIAENEYAKNSNTVLISIHADGFSNENAEGKTLFHWPTSKKGKLLAEKLHNHLKYRAVGSRGIRKNDTFKIIRSPANTPVVLVEAGFMTNPGDVRYLYSAEGRISTAKMIYRGILDYMGEI